MAVDTTQLTSIYNTLSTDVKATLDEQWNSKRLLGADYANVVAQTMTALIQTSAQLLQADAQLAEQSTEFNAQLAQDAPVKTAQKTLIDNQSATELKKALLTVRQTSMYDDNLRVEEAKALKDVTGMYGVGGTTLPTDTTTGTSLSQVMIDAINKITP